MKKIIIPIFFLVLLISIVNSDIKSIDKKIVPKELPKITYTPISKTTCYGKICNQVIESSIKYVYEDNQWKNIENARSLKGSGIDCIVDSDGENLVECIDWNYTSRTLKISKKNSGDSPIRVLTPNENKTEYYEKSIVNYKFDNFLVNDEKDIIVKADYNDIVHFGVNSTTISLQTAESENLDDAYIDQDDPYVSYGSEIYLKVEYAFVGIHHTIIKFNISSLSPTDSIINSTLSLCTTANNLESGESIDVYSHRVYTTYNWNENTITWNTAPSPGTNYNVTPSDTVTIAYNEYGSRIFDVTNIISKSLLNNEDDISIYLTTGNPVGSTSRDPIVFASKEHPTTSCRPVLNITYSSDTIPPNVSIISPTDTNYTTTTIQFNISANDSISGISSCSYKLDSGSNISMSNSSDIYYSTNSSMTQGSHTIYFYCEDTVGNINDTESVSFNIDSLPPSLNIIYPVQDNSYSTGTLDLNYSVSDLGVGLDTCWYLNDTGSNQTVACGTNTTISQPTDGSYTIYMWANDSLGNLASDSVNYSISTSSPAITLNHPTSSLYISSGTNVYFNFTAIDIDGLGICQLWTNTTSWNKNYTWGNPTSGLMNYTTLNITSDGVYKYNIWCNDTASNGGFSAINKTFTIDTTYPKVSISFPSNGSSVYGLAIVLTYQINETNSDTCLYTVRDSLGAVNNGLSGESLNCSGTSESFAVNKYDTFTINVTITDLAGNKNNSLLYFTTIPTPSSSSSSGGGGGTTKITVIAIIPPESYLGTLTDLQRAIIYSQINKYSNNSKFLAFGDDSEISSLIQTLKDRGISLTYEEIKDFIEQFKNNQIENVKVEEKQADLYSLVKSSVVIQSGEFIVNPSIISGNLKNVLVCDPTEVSFEVTPTKALKSCVGANGFLCNVTNPNKATVYYEFMNGDEFFFRTLKGEVSYVSTTDETAKTNIETYNVLNYCANINNTGIPIFVPFFGVVFVGMFFIYVKNPRIKTFINDNKLIKSLKKGR